MACTALVRTDVKVNPNTPSGLTPADLESAYNLPSTSKGSGQVVAIVDAYDNPNVASDLAEYRSTFGLGTAQFTKYNQEGQQSNYPEGDTGWGVEIDLDVAMVSASCPNCTIWLFEANSNNFLDLAAAEVEAVKLGATIISNSYSATGCKRICSQKIKKYFGTRGVTYLASAGDDGYGIGVPAQLESVVSVGGTDLTPSSGSRGWQETVWDGSGAGCSKAPKPYWQHDKGCKGRTANDVSADGGVPVAEYDTYGQAGWIQVYGTSVSSPLLGGVFGLAGNSTKQSGGKAFWTLSGPDRKKDLFEITSGNDGTCTPTYLCTAGTGEYKDYSGPAGWGTPNGIAAF
jgi:subtilase family serine protease